MKLFFLFFLYYGFFYQDSDSKEIKEHFLSTKKWTSWYAYMKNNKIGQMQGLAGNPGNQGHFIFKKKSDGTYLISTKKWPNWYVYMEDNEEGTVRGWNGDPGIQGHWILKEISNDTYLISSRKWPNWYMYMSNTKEGIIRGHKGNPGKQGHWIFHDISFQQIHLSYTSNSDEMRVMWISPSYENVESPYVIYGVKKEELDMKSYGSTKTYKASDMCQAPATNEASFVHPGWIHDAVMKNLQPDTIYYYKVSTKKNGFSKIHQFKTMSEITNSNKIMSFFIYGDSGIYANAQKTYDLVQRDLQDPNQNYVSLLHVGDISYALGNSYKWEEFGKLIEPIATKIPYMVSIGNHEYCYTSSSGEKNDPSLVSGEHRFVHPRANYGKDSGGECAVPVVNRYHMPDNGNKVFWYSFKTGLVHHIVLSFEHNFLNGSYMRKWLENDLKAIDRKKTPWVMVYAHRPLYTSEKYAGDYKMSILLREHLEDLFYSYGVDAVFTGHYHSYERTCPVYKSHCQEENGKARAPTHIMIGSAGYELDNTGFYGMPWSMKGYLEHGYGRMHVYNHTHIQIEFVQNKNEQISDSKWIVSDHTWHHNPISRYLLSTLSDTKSTYKLSNTKAMIKTKDPIPWILSQRKDDPDTYLITSMEYPDYYLHMTDTKEGWIEGVFADPKESGYWKITERNGYKLFSTVRWPNWFMYFDNQTNKVRGHKGEPKYAAGHWKMVQLG